MTNQAKKGRTDHRSIEKRPGAFKCNRSVSRARGRVLPCSRGRNDPDNDRFVMRRAALASLVLSCFVATSIAPATAHAYATAIEDSASSRGWAHVAVDTSGVGEAGPVLRRRVQERADVVLRSAGVMPGRGPQDPTITVVIKEITGDDPAWEHTVTLTRGESATKDGVTQTCPLCTETELIEAIEGRLATLAADLEADATEPATDPTTAPTDPDPTEPKPIVTTDDTSSGKLGTKGKAGIALVALGAAGVVAGLVLIVLPDRPKTGDLTREVFTQPPGYGVLAGGAVSLVVGAVLLGIDRKQAKKQGKQSGRKHARVRLGAGGVVHF